MLVPEITKIHIYLDLDLEFRTLESYLRYSVTNRRGLRHAIAAGWRSETLVCNVVDILTN